MRRLPTITTPARLVAAVVVAAMLLPSYGAAVSFVAGGADVASASTAAVAAREGTSSTATRGGGGGTTRRSTGLRGGGGGGGGGAGGSSHQRSLVVGTPTGGGEYPFLVAVHWAQSEMDPRSPMGPYCHGTMIAPDVVLTSWSCRPDHGYVMVGDSSNSSFIQFRNVVAMDPTYHGLVSHPHGYHHMFQIEPVTFPGFYPATMNKDPGGVFAGQEVTVVGYGANKVLEDVSFPGEAYEARLVVINAWDSAYDCTADGVGACNGDLGGPVLNSSKSLIGMVNWYECGHGVERHARISHVIDWIERNACGLSARKEAIPYCPDLVCPSDARLMGYPWALLPNGTGSVEGIHGFVPIQVTQWPPPGTPLWRNSTTNVTITATDASGRTRQCQWVVLVPPLVELGQVELDLPVGTYTASGFFSVSQITQVLSGRVYKMSGRTSDRVRGTGSSVSAYLRKRSSRYTGRGLTLKQNKTKGSVIVPDVPIRFGISNQNEQRDVEVSVNVTQNGGQNNVTYRVFGQVQDFLF